MDNETEAKINDPVFLKLTEELKCRNQSGPDVDDATLHALGLLIVNFQRLEAKVAELIQALLTNSHRKGIEALSSEFLVRVNGNVWVVTAGHVVRDMKEAAAKGTLKHITSLDAWTDEKTNLG